jgi:hypothetical protein
MDLVPLPPGDFDANSGVDRIEVDLSWVYLDDLAHRVEVWYRLAGGDWGLGVSLSIGSTSFLFRGLDPATAYEFRARTGRGPDGFTQYSGWTPSITVTTCDGNPKNGRCGGGGNKDDGTNDGNPGNKGGKGKDKKSGSG